MMNNNLLSVNNNQQLSYSNPNLNSNGVQGNLMRNPGSDIDLTALYNNNGNNFGFQNQNFGLQSVNPQMMNISSPVRSAPAPPTNQTLNQFMPPQITVTPNNGQLPTFEIDTNQSLSQSLPPQIAMTPNQGPIYTENDANQSLNQFIPPQITVTPDQGQLPNTDFDSNPFNDPKPSLTKTDSFISYTEPGPVTTEEVPRSPSTNEFMAILERNSAILAQATEKNQEMAATTEALKQENSALDEVKFTDDIVDGEKEETAEQEEINESTEKDQIVEDKKEENEKAVKKGLFSRWGGSKDKAKTPGTPPNSPEPIPPTESASQGRGGNEQKFMGEGQMFKGKLIGVLEVQEARGDRMCQDALQELKTAIKASGEHKQKILIHIAVDGLKIRDEKTGDCLYHHPVHKISFIAQDMSDSRAFGYIYGSPENGHRFFGIKTEKAAGQVVVAMRDLFQVVFELKQKEIDDALRKMDKDKREGMLPPHHPSSTMQQQHLSVTSTASFPDGSGAGVAHMASAPQPPNRAASGALSDLLGLENELTSIQAGIRQIDKIAPNPPMSFQTDSMIPIGSLQPSSNSFPANEQMNYPGLPHAPTVQQAQALGPVTTEVQSPINPALMTQAPQPILQQQRPDPFGATPFLPPPPSSHKSGRGSQGRYAFPPSGNAAMINNEDRYAAFEALASNGFGGPPPAAGNGQMETNMFPPAAHQQQGVSLTDNGASRQQQPSSNMGMVSSIESNNANVELFTDLDPLGTGKSKPYVDKKDFFSELKSTSPKLGNMSSSNSRESPVPGIEATAPVSSTVGLPDVSCPQQFVHNTSQRSSLRSTNQPTPPPRSGSELTYGHLESSRRISYSQANFGFSSHLSKPTCVLTTSVLSTTSSATLSRNTITSIASSWRSSQQNSSGIRDTRLYHTLGRPMTTFNNRMDIESSSTDSSLRVTMQAPDSCVDQSEEIDENRYGSIPQLESSPRRYNRLKDQNVFHYDTSGPNLPIPTRESSEIPPKLPEKPKQRSNSPPPLPPKKPTTKTSLIGITSFNRPEPETQQPPIPDVVSGHEIYDFPPMPMLGSHKLDKEEAKQCIQDILEQETNPLQDHHESSKHLPVSVEELSKMSLIDLNAKLLTGQLPEEMKGMSILELVDFINEEVKRKKLVQQTSMKPSFSDNFVCDKVEVLKTEVVPEEVPLSATSKEVGFAFPSNEIEEIPEDVIPEMQEHQIQTQVAPSSGFDDDFTPFSINSHLDSFRPASQATSDHSVLSKPDEYDKYAVFRELQMEEELIKAWKTPSDEEKPVDDLEEELEEPELEEDKETKPVCSSEGSPCSRSDTQSPMKSYSVDEPNDEEEEPSERAEVEEPRKRESQVPIFHQNEEDYEPESKISNNDEDLFSNTFDDPEAVKMSKTWTTFDDQEEVDVLPTPAVKSNPVNYFNSENAFQDNFGDPVDWASVAASTEDDEQETKPQMTRQLSSDSQNSISKCKRFSHRHVDADHICRGHSTEAKEPEPETYTDWWPPSAGGAPKTKNNGGTGNEAYSATPDHKPQVSSWSEGDAFGEPLEAKFKVFSKVIHDRSMTPNDPISDNDSGIIPKSDSVNIFSIKDDPFDDDFFH